MGVLIFFGKKIIRSSLLCYSSLYIDVFVSLSNFPNFRFTGFYGSPKPELRKFSWDLFRSLSGFSNLIWLVVRDFNEILSVDEKIGGERNNYQIENFITVISDVGLFELGFEGPKFTWKGPKYGADYIRANLGKGLSSTNFS